MDGPVFVKPFTNSTSIIFSPAISKPCVRCRNPMTNRRLNLWEQRHAPLPKVLDTSTSFKEVERTAIAIQPFGSAGTAISRRGTSHKDIIDDIDRIGNINNTIAIGITAGFNRPRRTTADKNIIDNLNRIRNIHYAIAIGVAAQTLTIKITSYYKSKIQRFFKTGRFVNLMPVGQTCGPNSVIIPMFPAEDQYSLYPASRWFPLPARTIENDPDRYHTGRMINDHSRCMSEHEAHTNPRKLKY